MTDFNMVKIENNFNAGSLRFLNPKNWFKEKLTKDNVNILFVDDLDMPVVESLKKAGYRVKKIRDINNIYEAEVINAQIIFVDFDGVGKSISPQHQGAGLIKELKTNYGKTKYVVLYTAQPALPTDTTMNSLFDLADDRMPKDSDVTDFTAQIRKALKTIG